MVVADESLSFSDLVDRGRLDVLTVDSFVEEDFFPDDDFTLFVDGFEGFFEDFCRCLLECCR